MAPRPRRLVNAYAQVNPIHPSESVARRVFSAEAPTHDPPLVTLDYPLTIGKSWQSTSTVSGLALGVVTVYSESYDFEVDQQGDMTTPFGTFPVLRLRSTLTRTFGLIDTVVRSHGFMTECFGLVASARSQDNEASVEFTNAAELRRIIP